VNAQLQPPEPFVPPEADLNGYEYMPLYGERLFNSDFNLTVSDRVFRITLRMWWKAWLQVPAASLPSEETSLCKLAGLDSLAAWRKVRDEAMRNFVLCSDGRYYHSFLAPLACAAWTERVKYRARAKLGGKAKAAKHPASSRPNGA
jgi:hypothetical protein